MKVVPKNQGSKQLFKNPILDKLTRTHIAVPITIFILYSAGLLYWSIVNTSLNKGLTTLLFFVGWIVFTWVEYITHRYIFHLKTYTKLRAKIQYTMHGVHHEFPKDKERLAMPPLVSVLVSTMLLLLLRVVMGDFVFAFLPGFLTGYACYLGVHYMVHAYQPPKNIFKSLWVNHGIHHYKNGDIIFGVSSPLWDYIYGTIKQREIKRH